MDLTEEAILEMSGAVKELAVEQCLNRGCVIGSTLGTFTYVPKD